MKGLRLFEGLLLIAFSSALTSCGGRHQLAVSTVQAPTYQLGPGDKLKVTVFGEAALDGQYMLTPNGDLAFPLVGDVKATGMSAAELQKALTARLADGYMLDPRVAVEVLSYRPFYILGEVTRAGEYPYVANLSALQAVAAAGGYTYRANQRRIFILRAGASTEEVYDLKGAAPVWIMPGDTVRVGERYF